MSKKKEEVLEQNEKKVMTKYDLKMQKREEQKRQEAKEKKIGTAVGVVVVLALLALVLSFPIRTYMSINSAYCLIGDEKITKVEFDYNYNIVKSNIMNSYGSYFSMLGYDTSQDISNQMYSDTMTWGDYFQEMTVDSIKRSKALENEAKAAGFTCDTTEKYDEYLESVNSAAKQSNITLKKYLQQSFGEYATLKRLEPYIKDSIYANAYYDKVADDKAPSDDEITAYYNDNKNNYDNVDYYLTTIEAQLPTEPTELAENTEVEEGEEYVPSEAEVKKAMEEAFALCDEAEENIFTEGSLREAATYASTTSVIAEWVYDESRKNGDTAILEDTSSNSYYVVGFEKRYRPDDPTASANVIVINNEDTEETADTIYEQWKNGDATRESFETLANEINSKFGVVNNGGYLETITKTSVPEQVANWLFDENRKEGDTSAIDTGDGYTYIIYFVNFGNPEWMTTIKTTLVNDAMLEYVDEISSKIDVKDPSGNLSYLNIADDSEAAEDAQTDSTEEVDETIIEDVEATEE